MLSLKNKINTLLIHLAKKLNAVLIYDKQVIQNKVAKLTVGEYTYGVENIKIDRYKGSDRDIIIGKFCSIATNVTLITGGIHPVNWVSTFPFRAKFNLEGKFEDGLPTSNGPIIIGNDVWISSNVTILSGITIGNGAVLASNAVITKDVPPYAIVGGNPAKIIKMRFSDAQIEKLEKIKWWDWDKDIVIKNVHLLSSGDVDEFIKIKNI